MNQFIKAGFGAAFLTLFICGFAAAQTLAPAKTAPAENALITSTDALKTMSAKLLLLQEAEVKAATEKLEQLRQLVAEGLVARNELQTGEAAVKAAQAKLDATKQQIADADKLVADTRAAEELAKQQAARNALALAQSKNVRSLTRPTMLRYNGVGSFVLANLPTIQTFFFEQFGRALPTSAIGQSSTHNALNYDHRNAVDVALRPDSVEGQALIAFLQSKGIPFLAFRGAIPGVATGPHIHIGSPSHRLA